MSCCFLANITHAQTKKSYACLDMFCLLLCAQTHSLRLLSIFRNLVDISFLLSSFSVFLFVLESLCLFLKIFPYHYFSRDSKGKRDLKIGICSVVLSPVHCSCCSKVFIQPQSACKLLKWPQTASLRLLRAEKPFPGFIMSLIFVPPPALPPLPIHPQLTL